MHSIYVPESARERGRLMGLEKPIDPKTSAGIAIDFQRFFMDEGQPMGNSHALDIIDNANRINSDIRGGGGIVIFTQHSIDQWPESADQLNEHDSAQTVLSRQELRLGSDSYELHPRIIRMQDDISVIKHQSSALHPRSGTDLLRVLKEHAIQTVIITGLVTNGCCESTARDAFQHGFNVVFASDGTAAMTDQEHNAALLSLSLYYAQVMSTEVILKYLHTP